jgi:hypothetical protein
MQIRQGETLSHQGEITHEVCCSSAHCPRISFDRKSPSVFFFQKSIVQGQTYTSIPVTYAHALAWNLIFSAGALTLHMFTPHHYIKTRNLGMNALFSKESTEACLALNQTVSENVTCIDTDFSVTPFQGWYMFRLVLSWVINEFYWIFLRNVFSWDSQSN